ncbi:pyridoxamine 5'-phosphate oxidase family protein [Thermopolyspora sp. NPDC052614]|uniref:pyridoxamine 5'-phosphate oxidase family protein n=1 Tax=Thermopolyspora sp. NPDC052614 TaxID=3155682 RepID=UPI00342DA607
MSDISTMLSTSQAPVVDAYFTCELATISKSGVPIAWPVVALRHGDGTFLITTSIALPQKAFNIRREPKVAMLFSDPTGTGFDTLPEILVQGTADCPDKVVTSPQGLEPYWTKLWHRQPPMPLSGARSPVRRFFDWYYMRLLITVTPVRVTERPSLDAGVPARTAPTSPTDGPAVVQVSDLTDPFGRANASFSGYRSAVLSTIDPEGFTSLRRVRLVADPSSGSFLIDLPGTATPHPGPASILCHSHDDTLQKLRTSGCLGHVGVRDGAWTFTPTRFVPGTGDEGPVAMYRAMKGVRRTAARYLAARNLPRPSISWNEFEVIKRQAASTTRAAG